MNPRSCENWMRVAWWRPRGAAPSCLVRGGAAAGAHGRMGPAGCQPRSIVILVGRVLEPGNIFLGVQNGDCTEVTPKDGGQRALLGGPGAPPKIPRNLQKPEGAAGRPGRPASPSFRFFHRCSLGTLRDTELRLQCPFFGPSHKQPVRAGVAPPPRRCCRAARPGVRTNPSAHLAVYPRRLGGALGARLHSANQCSEVVPNFFFGIFRGASGAAVSRHSGAPRGPRHISRSPPGPEPRGAPE